MTELHRLLECLRQGARPPLSADDIELLLGWLTGSATREGEHGSEMPRPGHDPVLLQMVLYRLDDELFDGGELKLSAAGLDVSEPTTRRRIRFRRLASAFHPDRFPDLTDWLTQRSQAVHRAYGRFKQNPDGPGIASSPAQSYAEPHAVNRKDMPSVRRRRIRAFANRLRARFGNDRFLAQKLIGGLTLLALLPVLNMVLVPVSGPDETVSGFRFPVSGEDQDGAAGDSLQVDGEAGASGDGSAQDAPPTTRQPANQPTSEAATGVRPDDDRGPDDKSLARQSLTPVEGSGSREDPETGQAQSTGTGGGLADDGWDHRVAALQGQSTDPNDPAGKDEPGNRKPSPSRSDPEISPLLAAARRAMNPNGAIATVAALQTVDEQLAAMGLENDTERLYRRIGGEEKVNGREMPDAEQEKKVSGSGFRVSGIAEDDAGGEADEVERAALRTDREASLAEQADAASQQATKSTSKPASNEAAGPAREGRNPESRFANAPSNAAETAEPDARGRNPETQNPKPPPVTTGKPDDSAHPEAGNPNPDIGASSALPSSALVLGALSQHPTGEVLRRFHVALQVGNIPGIAGTFTEDARFDALRGRAEIAGYFRKILSDAGSRQVNLRVSRLARDDEYWKVEIDLDISVQDDAIQSDALAGRGQLWLVEHSGRLAIDRMEIE